MDIKSNIKSKQRRSRYRRSRRKVSNPEQSTSKYEYSTGDFPSLHYHSSDDCIVCSIDRDLLKIVVPESSPTPQEPGSLLNPQVSEYVPQSCLNPQAPEYVPQSGLNPQAAEYVLQSWLNPQAAEYVPQSLLKPFPLSSPIF